MKKTFTIVLLFILILGIQNIFGIYQMLEVDGIRVTISGIKFTKGYSNPKNIGRIDINQDVDLTNDPNDVLTAGVVISLEPDVSTLEFDTIGIEMTGGVYIKGHSYVEADDTHVYTTSTGIKELSGAGSTWAAPLNYDYLHVEYFYYPSDEGGGSRTLETTFLNEQKLVDTSQPVNISLLADTYRVAYYWDGDDSTRHGFVQTVPYHDPESFPSGDPVISITYLPFYVAVNQDVTSETYVVSDSLDNLSDPYDNFDVKKVMYMTLCFDDSDNSFYIGRTANWDGLDVNFSLAQFVRTGTYDSSTGTYQLGISNYTDGDGFQALNTLEDFSRLEIGETGDAGFIDNQGYYTTETLHFKRVK